MTSTMQQRLDSLAADLQHELRPTTLRKARRSARRWRAFADRHPDNTTAREMAEDAEAEAREIAHRGPGTRHSPRADTAGAGGEQLC